VGLSCGYLAADHHCIHFLRLGLVSFGWCGLWLRSWRRLTWCVVLGLLVGQSQVLSLADRHRRDPLRQQDGRRIDLSGVVVTSPSRGPASLRFLLEIESPGPGAAPPDVEVLLISSKGLPQVAMGERWRFSGTLQAPPSATYPGGPDRALQLGRKGIWHQLLVRLFREQPQRLFPPRLDGPWGAVMCLRARLVDCFRRRFQGRQAELMVGIVLGEAQGLDDDLQQAFRATGTSHLLAASGANVAIVLGVLLWLGERCGYSSYRLALPCLAVVWLTVALAGFSPSIVRAGWMSAVALLARALGRQASVGRCLSLACLIALAIHPEYVYDVSFQLSAGAVACLVTLGQAMSNLSKRRLWRQIAMTASVMIGLWPIFAWQFQSCQPAALVCNVLLAPPMEALLPVGLVLAGLDFVWAPLAQPLVWLSQATLSTVLWLVLHLSPRAPQLVLTRPTILELAIWLFGTLALYSALKRRWSISAGFWAAGVIALLWLRQPSHGPGRLIVRVVEAKHGLALWVSTPAGRQCLLMQDKAQQTSLESMLRTHGVTLADVLLLRPRPNARGHRIFKTADDVQLELVPDTVRLRYGRIRISWGGDNRPATVWVGDPDRDPPGPTLPPVWPDAGVTGGWSIPRDGPLELESDGVRLRWRRWT
jgi:ComEC/Rec2-related protein